MWTILLTAVILFLFGALWFTFIFGKVWTKLMNFSEEDMQRSREKGMTKPLIINFLLCIVNASVIYYLLPVLMSLTLGEFIKLILIICAGFTLPQYVNQALWERKSWKLVVMNCVHAVIYFSIGAAVVYYMQ